MATIVLAAAGAALGGSVGGSVLGLSGAVLGRAIGATVGRVIDQRLMGSGSAVVETGRLTRYRVTGASEGAAIPAVFGRIRVGGQVIWSSAFQEHSKTSSAGGGKGGGSGPKVKSYSYSVSLAVAVCEGEITRIGRVWADGIEVAQDSVTMRVYTGSESQVPDPLIESIEGAGRVPAYRGLAYVVFESLQLEAYGNRVPQFSFEVIRGTDPALVPPEAQSLAQVVRGVALIPGSGEYSLATTPVHLDEGLGRTRVANVNTAAGSTDFQASLDHLVQELPNCGSVALVVSWFGDDLRVGSCSLRPKVEQTEIDAAAMPWQVCGVVRADAEIVPQEDERPIYGGTPADQSVIEAIQALQDRGQRVVFYPFILMDQVEGNTLPNPWTGATGQPHLPWRGRITTSLAPGQSGTTDGTAAAETEVEAFFGTASPADFAIVDGRVQYSGPAEWSFRRFILHYAHLCALAGGVDSFCIGSEMRSLTQIRGAGASFPAVQALRTLASDVRGILGPVTRIGYCADWSEYFGYHPKDGSGDVYFHLDPLWGDPAIDFIGIDNYMPLSDWRDEPGHADEAWPSIYDLGYLKANVAGGEGYDWYYGDEAGRSAQDRLPIEDGAYGEPWVFRYKDLVNWWRQPHHERRGGIRLSLVADGARPNGWTAAGGAAVSPESGTHLGRYSDAARIASGGDLGDGAETVGFSVLAAAPYTVGLWAKEGSSGALSVECRLGGAEVATVAFEFGSQSFSLSGGGATVSDAHSTDVGEGVVWLSFTVAFAGAGTGALRVGPASTAVGDDVLIVAAEVHAVGQSTTAWVPQSKPIWFTEFGCGAMDKGTNQPNKFLDPKSSESKLAYFSNGRRDDLIQAQYIRATMSFWQDAANNPVSIVYGDRMVDVDRAHVWAWDARPYPAFPGLNDIWSDGRNYSRGHWLTGRATTESLPAVLAEICARAGITNVDVSGVYGLVRGYEVDWTDGVRGALQSLILAHGLSVAERGGVLVFRMRDARPVAEVLESDVAVVDEIPGRVERIRAPRIEAPGRLQMSYVAFDGDFDVAATEATAADETLHGVERSELPMAFTRGEARAIVDRWLAESHVAQDSVKLALPPSRTGLSAGDVFSLDGHGLYRVDHVEDGAARLIEAVRVEPGLFAPGDMVDEYVPLRPWQVAGAPMAVFLDLPLLKGDEIEHAPHIAVTADPFPGPVAVYSAAQDSGYALNGTVETRAVIGQTLTPLDAAAPGVWDRGPALRVYTGGGTLASAELDAVLNGGNGVAIGSGSDGIWEIFQFAEATLVGPDLYDLRLRLRGQLGTDAIMPPVWPVGSIVVALDQALVQLDLPASARGLDRHYRFGPADLSYDSASFRHEIRAFDGVGLRPYAPVHLRAVWSGADLSVTWIRRTRVDGDSWLSLDVPLGEASERYFVRVVSGAQVVREIERVTPSWTYSAAQQSNDGVSAPFSIEVAQISDRFGPGPFRRIDIHD